MAAEDNLKRCTKCKQLCSVEKFSKNARCRDGLASWCNSCRYLQLKGYRRTGPKPKKYISTVCSVRRCRNKRYNNGYCSKHNAKWKKYGNPLYVAPPRRRNPLTWDERMRANDFERWADMKRQAYIKRRRLLRSAKQESYSRREIFERDGWMCGICGKRINRRLKGRTSRAPSIDHIIPLAIGGDDTPGNVQAAHFGCNSGKCNRVREEVMSNE